MKAQSLWVGHNYAYIAGRGRDRRYSPDAQNVRVVRTSQRRLYGNKNDTTFAQVYFCDWEGNKVSDESTEVRAYDIVDFWDDYWNEHSEDMIKTKKYREEANQRAKEERERYRLQREAADAAEAERREKLQTKKNEIRKKLTEVGFDGESTLVNISYDGDMFTIREPELSRWLNAQKEEVRLLDL